MKRKMKRKIPESVRAFDRADLPRSVQDQLDEFNSLNQAWIPVGDFYALFEDVERRPLDPDPWCQIAGHVKIDPLFFQGDALNSLRVNYCDSEFRFHIQEISDWETPIAQDFEKYLLNGSEIAERFFQCVAKLFTDSSLKIYVVNVDTSSENHGSAPFWGIQEHADYLFQIKDKLYLIHFYFTD